VLRQVLDVVGVKHQDDIGAAQLQDRLLEVTPGLLTNDRACALRTGHRDTLKAGGSDDGGDLVMTGEHVDVRAVRESGVGEGRLQGQRRPRLPRIKLGTAKRATW